MDIEIEIIEPIFTVCQVKDYSQVDLTQPFCFIGKTDQENSLVCPSELVPENVIKREDDWRAFRVKGQLDFSLVGILAQISQALALEGISIFAVSTFDTDYILVKYADYDEAVDILTKHGYTIFNYYKY